MSTESRSEKYCAQKHVGDAQQIDTVHLVDIKKLADVMKTHGIENFIGCCERICLLVHTFRGWFNYI